MRTNLITRLKEEWNNLDPVDPLRGLIDDAIDALAEKTPLSTPLPYNKEDLEELDNGLVLAYKLGWKSAEEAHGIKGDA